MSQVNKIALHDEICRKMHQLYERKNADYGDSFAQLRHRYPNFVHMRIFDKLNRLETITQPGHELKVTDETVEDTLMDIANYAIMEIVERRVSKLNEEQSTSRYEREHYCCCGDNDKLLSKKELYQRVSALKAQLQPKTEGE